jgi:hypothetical protein
MIASFAAKEKLKGNSAGHRKRRAGSSIGCCKVCGYEVPVVVALSLSVRAAELAVLAVLWWKWGGKSARRGRAWAVRDCAKRLRSWRFTRERLSRGRTGGRMLIGRELSEECAARAR